MAEEPKFATDYDGPWKDALDFAPELFLRRFLPRIAAAIDWAKPFVAAHLATRATRKDLARRQEAKIRLLCNLQSRKLDQADGREWYRLIDFLMKLPAEMNNQVHETVFRQHTEEAMKYVSFAERQGAKKILRSVMIAKFGAEGAALVDALEESADQPRLEALATAAALALSLDEVRPLFQTKNGNGALSE